MPTSIDSQLAAIKAVAELRPEQIVRAGLAPRPAQAEILRSQLVDAYNTFRHVASDERIRRYVEKLNKR
jgi:hypothetical protein